MTLEQIDVIHASSAATDTFEMALRRGRHLRVRKAGKIGR